MPTYGTATANRERAREHTAIEMLANIGQQIYIDPNLSPRPVTVQAPDERVTRIVGDTYRLPFSSFPSAETTFHRELNLLVEALKNRKLIVQKNNKDIKGIGQISEGDSVCVHAEISRAPYFVKSIQDNSVELEHFYSEFECLKVFCKMKEGSLKPFKVSVKI